jgi:hypothetical protein
VRRSKLMFHVQWPINVTRKERLFLNGCHSYQRSRYLLSSSSRAFLFIFIVPCLEAEFSYLDWIGVCVLPINAEE